MIISQEDPNAIYFGAKMNLALMKNVVALNLDDMIPFQAAFGLRPDSELAEMMNLFLLKLKEAGLYQHIRKKWNLEMEQRVNHWEQVPDSATALGFENLTFPFLILSVGLVFSLAFSLVERLLRISPHRKLT